MWGVVGMGAKVTLSSGVPQLAASTAAICNVRSTSTPVLPFAQRAFIRESAAACHASSPRSRMESRCWQPSGSPSADGPAAIPLASELAGRLKRSQIGLESTAICRMSDKDVLGKALRQILHLHYESSG